MVLLRLFNEAKPLENLGTITQANLVWLCFGGSFCGGLGLLVLFSTLFLGASARELLRVAHEIEREGITAPGVIIDKWIDKGGEFTAHFVGYRFSHRGDQWVGRDVVKPTIYKKLQIGDNLAICFLPRNPRVSRIELGKTTEGP